MSVLGNQFPVLKHPSRQWAGEQGSRGKNKLLGFFTSILATIPEPQRK